MVPEATRRFRDQSRQSRGSVRYNGWLHLAFSELTCSFILAFAVSRVESPSASEWLMVPGTFLFANVVEYLGHRNPMHRPVRGLEPLFRRHTREHHRFFTASAMGGDSHRDYFLVLFPPALLGFFLGGIALPVAAFLFVVATPNVAWFFVAVAMAYYSAYEFLHFAYHQPDGSHLFRIPGLPFLRRHHLRHHDPVLMTRWNFNISFPIVDVVLGTRWTAAARPASTLPTAEDHIANET